MGTIVPPASPRRARLCEARSMVTDTAGHHEHPSLRVQRLCYYVHKKKSGLLSERVVFAVVVSKGPATE